MMRALPLIVLALTGCAERAFGISGPGASDSDFGEPPSPSETESAPTALDTGSATQLAPPMYWSLDGELAVLAGEIDLASSAAVVRTWDDLSQALCAYDLDIAAADIAMFEDPEVQMFGWWSLALSEGIADDARCADWPAQELMIGIGEYDARLDPALHARGWDSASVYGMYLQQAGESLYLVGVSGTLAHLAGQASADATVPPSDGIYELHSVVLLDLSQ